MEEKGIERVYTTPAKTKVIHMMLQEDRTTKKIEQEYQEYVKRGKPLCMHYLQNEQKANR